MKPPQKGTVKREERTKQKWLRRIPNSYLALQIEIVK